MDLTTLLRICRAYSDLGWAVQEQLGQLVDEGESEGLNPNAVRQIERFLDSAARQIGDEDFTDEVQRLKDA